MASRRDLIQAFQFAARRVVSAAVMRQTDPTEWPYRRLGGAGFGAVMVTVIALGAVGVYGMIVPGGKTSWKDGSTVIVVKETGASYVYLKGELHPTLNFTSAALIAGTTQITSTAAASLQGYKRGVELGIDGAPATLPTTKDMVKPPWSLCTQQTPNNSGKLVSRTRLVVSKAPDQGSAPGDKAVLVTDTGSPDHPVANQGEYLVWHDYKYKLDDVNAASIALELQNDVNIPVGSAWLQGLPVGEDIAPIKVDGAGSPSRAVPGVTTGHVVQVQTQDKGTLYYLAEADQLVPISFLQMKLQLAGGAGGPDTITPDQAAAANRAPTPQTSREQPPTTVPAFVRPNDSNTVLCASYKNGSFSPDVLVDSAIPSGGGLPTVSTSTSGDELADRVWLPPGKAALVESMATPKSNSGPLYLVTDEGKRYAIPSNDVLTMLGLSSKSISKLPSSVLVRIPEGPALDPNAAEAALAEEDTDK
jgi:type VII secretion protein EccB